MLRWIWRRLPRPLRSLLRWLFILVAPLFALQFIQGLCEGMLHFSTSVTWLNVATMTLSPHYSEIQIMGHFTDLAQWTLEPQGVPKLINPLTWWQRLGMQRNDAFEDGMSFRNMYHPSKLRRHVRRGDPRGKWHHWVYIHGGERGDTDEDLHRVWAEAFDELMIYHGEWWHSKHPAANGASFHHLSCEKKDMLCVLWSVQGPALVHFTTETVDGILHDGVRVGETAHPKAVYEPVMMRVIDLPAPSKWSQLPPGQFPTPFNQLRAVTENPEAWKRWPAQGPVERIHMFLSIISMAEARRLWWSYGLLYNLDRAMPPFARHMANPAYAAGWVISTSGLFIYSFGLSHFVEFLYDLPPRLRNKDRLESMGAWAEWDREIQAKLSEIILEYFSCVEDSHSNKGQLPEVVRIKQRLLDMLTKETREAFQNGDPAAKRECKSL